MDVAWGAAIAVAGAASFLASTGHGVPARRWPLAAAAVLWGVRLALARGGPGARRGRGSPLP